MGPDALVDAEGHKSEALNQPSEEESNHQEPNRLVK